MKRFIGIAVVLLASGACSYEYSQICDRMIECGVAQDEDGCKLTLTPLKYSAECQAAMAEATCEEIARDPRTWTACWQPCSYQGTKCNETGETLSGCQNGLEIVLSCTDGCAMEYSSNSSSCGLVGPNGEISSTGEVCWCLINHGQ
jgi:hypothetical protein